MVSSNQDKALPHWDLTNVYPGLDSDEFNKAVDQVRELIAGLEEFLGEQERIINGNKSYNLSEISLLIEGYIDRLNELELVFDTVLAYVYSFIATDSYDTNAKRSLSELEIIGLGKDQLDIRFKGLLKSLDGDNESLSSLLTQDGTAAKHALFVKESVAKSRYLMSEAEESLASELSLSGASAWAKLHGIVNSQIKAEFQRNGEVEQLPITVIRNYYNDPDEALRKQAYEVEIAALENVRESLAASLNGIKGSVNTLNKRRGRPDYLHSSLEISRIDRETLEVLLSAMRDAFPDFRRYWRAKASLLGKDRLPFWDLYAPIGNSNRYFTYAEAREFILDQFATFSPRLVSFCRRAFDSNWIDAEPRDGKAGGAFCMSVIGVEEARILCNFDGSMDQLITLAHELGHAYHDHCFIGKTPLQRHTPMTIAETASIFNQTIITNAALDQADTSEQLAILDNFLSDCGQVVVDIYSRFLFESEVFEKRGEAELSADDFCEIMVKCQKETYGDGLDQDFLHPYMWAWKGHYYNPGFSFYNYPYAFGLLFGLGLFSIYQNEGDEFVESYDNLLSDSGIATPVELAARFNIDLKKKGFWESGLDLIRDRIDIYESYLDQDKPAE
ncbi:MAG: M3 family oligoendopeptidase [Anaerolineae bacterium]|nr:MAG: M3 family oligoendopeptidase [Anaerolineae bacterium]